jgi:hypothetical protein
MLLIAAASMSACAGAHPSAETPISAAGAAPKDADAEGGFTPFTDPTYGFQIDFFGTPERGETKTEEASQVTLTGYTASAGGEDRVQLLNVQIMRFPGGDTPERFRCKEILPALLSGMAVDRLGCGTTVSNLALLEHDPAGVFSITGDVPNCGGIAEAKTRIHVVCDQRTVGQVETYSLAAIAEQADDPMNKWFTCSLKLRGDVLTCPLSPPPPR